MESLKNNNKVVNEINGSGATAAAELIKCLHLIAVKTPRRSSYTWDNVKNQCKFSFTWDNAQTSGLGSYNYKYIFYNVEDLR